MRSTARACALIVLVGVLVGLAGCGGGPRTPPGVEPTAAPTGCTERVSDAAALRRVMAEAAPGARVCLTGDLRPARVELSRSGSPTRPIAVLGDGHTAVSGVTINVDHVVVSGLTVSNGQAPGMWIKGSDITVENNTVRHPVGGDYDGVRFFGANLTIRYNTISDIGKDHGDPDSPDPFCIQTSDRNNPGKQPPSTCHSRPDCLQTFATGTDSPIPNTGPSQHVLIQGNRCERIERSCLVAQGPHSRTGNGGGPGETADITFTDNYCEAHYTQAVLFDDVRRATITNNEIACTVRRAGNGLFKAFAFTQDSTGGTVAGNAVGSCVRYQAALDEGSLPGYRGPPSTAMP